MPPSVGLLQGRQRRDDPPHRLSADVAAGEDPTRQPGGQAEWLARRRRRCDERKCSLDRSPSGSSSGSATAVAASLCAAAIGTETDGSITSPCACASLVGLKPTLGLVSRSGIVPIAHSQDTAGPMARTVAECALLMNAIAGADPDDAITVARRVPRNIDFTSELGRTDLRGVRIGVARQFFGAFEKADVAIEEGVRALRGLGANRPAELLALAHVLLAAREIAGLDRHEAKPAQAVVDALV